MQLATANRLFAAVLVAGALLPASAQAQSSAISEYKLAVGSTLVLGEAASSGDLRVLNNGPASTEVRWFDHKLGAWESEVLGVGESLLSKRGAIVSISKHTLVCLLGQSSDSKDKAGYRYTTGFFALPTAPTPEDDKGKETKKDKAESKQEQGSTKGKPKQKEGASKSKPASKKK